MAFDLIDARRVGGVLTLTLDDPPTRNAMSPEMAVEVAEQLSRFEAEPGLRVLVLTGRDPSFCSGADVRRMNQAAAGPAADEVEAVPSDPWQGLEARLSEAPPETVRAGDAIDGVRLLPLKFHQLTKPCIAAVNGHAIGVGMGIALSCDIRIASEEARFAEAFVRNGLVPADGSCWQLPRMIGLSNTMLLQYTGDVIGAEEALRIGLVSRVTPHEELAGAAMELAQRLAQGATYAMSLTKRLVQKSLGLDFEESLRVAGVAQDIARVTEDHREGVRAFVEKRRPHFRGR